jgi:gliding motility-associated-like protein
MPATVQMCSPVELNLIPNTFGTGSTFVWSSSLNFSDTLNSSTTDSVLTITPPGSGTYYLQVSNGGCQKTDSVSVEFTSSAIQLSANDSICKGDSTLITVTNLNPAIQFTYAWSPVSIVSPTVGNSVWAQPSSTQFIVVTANSSTGCLIKDSVLIAVSSIDGAAVIASASSYTVPIGATVNLIGQPSGYSYQWSPSVGVQNPTQQQTSAQVDVSTIYTFSVSDGVCTKSDTVQIKTVNYLCGDAYIYVPNAFSPNSDGENDVMYVRGQMIEKMLFRIFDRWGELIFESTNRLDGWDGSYKGKKLDPDVYDYYLQATCIDGNEAIIKGNITLLK